MHLSSMTGFSRVKGDLKYKNSQYDWTWELKSVNAKGLDIKIRLPQWLDMMDEYIKTFCNEMFNRGTFNIVLDIRRDNSDTDVTVDESLLSLLTENVTKIYANNPQVFSKPSPAELLLVNGVVKVSEHLPDETEMRILVENLRESFSVAAEALKHDRQKEGLKIGEALQCILQQIRETVSRAETIAAGIPEKMRQKVCKEINDLVRDSGVTPERLEQEILFLIMRADVQEEIDRLKAHIKTADEILRENKPVGRRLDFLCQELNREANTLCSKSADIEQTKCGMELKALIEQFREQIQNME